MFLESFSKDYYQLQSFSIKSFFIIIHHKRPRFIYTITQTILSKVKDHLYTLLLELRSCFSCSFYLWMCDVSAENQSVLHNCSQLRNQSLQEIAPNKKQWSSMSHIRTDTANKAKLYPSLAIIRVNQQINYCSLFQDEQLNIILQTVLHFVPSEDCAGL